MICGSLWALNYPEVDNFPSLYFFLEVVKMIKKYVLVKLAIVYVLIKRLALAGCLQFGENMLLYPVFLQFLLKFVW